METLTDYSKAKAAGLKKIEGFSRDRWTDYNSHDPGITTLEYLCYALSDLASRTDLDMPDLLARADHSATDHFHKANEILPNRALTLLDYRKLLIDIDGIKNAWLQVREGSHRTITIDQLLETLSAEPIEVLESRTGYKGKYHDLRVAGQYDVVVQYHDWVRDEAKVGLLNEATQRLHANRNLCEDFSLPQAVAEEPVGICFNLQLEQSADNDAVIAEAAYQLDRFISPIIRFHSLQDMQRKGLQTSDIFNGPLLHHGFIDEDDLYNSELRAEIHASDLVQVLMDIPGVLAVSKLQMTSFAKVAVSPDPPQENAREWQPVIEDAKWVLPITPGKAPAFCLDLSRLIVFKENIPYGGDTDIIRYRFQQSKGRDFQRPLLPHELLLTLPKVTLDHSITDLSDYPTIQNHFPQVYGIGQEGLAGNTTDIRKNEARQLKAYLLIVEQLMANYLAQLDSVADLLSPQSVEHTLFTQQVNDIRDYNSLLVNAEDFAETLQGLAEDERTFERRRNQFLDHLMARLGEEFSEYSVLADGLYGAGSRRRLMADKQRLLNAYDSLSQQRAGGFNTLGVGRDSKSGSQDAEKISANESGLKKRLENFFGIGGHFETPFGFSERFYRIYDEIDNDNDNIQEWRFEIQDAHEGNRLSSTHKYETREAAFVAMQKALTVGLDPENYEIHPGTGGFYHVLRQPGEDDTVARKIQIFDSSEAAQANIDETVDFLRAHETLADIVVIEHNLLRPHRYVDMAGVTLPDDIHKKRRHWQPQTNRQLDEFDPSEYEYNDSDLLASCVDDEYADCPDSNPYAFRITVVLPYNVQQFRTMSFRQYLERFIRELTPAHILTKICWVDHPMMARLQSQHTDWRTAMASYRNMPVEGVDDHQRYRDLMQAQRELVKTLGQLDSVYPTGHLHDCKEGDQENPMILGQSKLGIFEENDNG
ncbi:Uncharacterised protein [BD1-7 clade bacterium]|uniref:Uncharacterized protein n=1 Tax=BD1-7 clade bacterium TaxID=2029982 RepID=A0A5S9QPQ0_9GAMM|nr:Uncharacterised protein [BD1-7 clade bacterium]